MRPGDADLSTVALILSGSGFFFFFLCGGVCACGGVCVCVRVRIDRISPCLIHSAPSPSASANDIEREY